MSSSAKGKQPTVSAQRATAAYREYDHPERKSLINELLDNLSIHEHLHAEMQGFLWISDIRRLRSLVRESRVVRQEEDKMNDNSENESDDDEDYDDGEDEDDEMDIDDIDDIDDEDGEDEGDEGDDHSVIKALPILFRHGCEIVRVSETCRFVNLESCKFNADHLGFLGCSRARLRKVPAAPSKNLRPDEIDPRVRDNAEKEEVSSFPHQGQRCSCSSIF